MASFNQSMRAHVAGSMNDRPAPEGSSGRGPVHGEPLGPGAPGGGPQAARRREPDPARPDRRRTPTSPGPSSTPRPCERLGRASRPGASSSRSGSAGTTRRTATSSSSASAGAGPPRLAGMESIACVVVTGGATAEDLLEDQLVENSLREDLRPVEQARAYRTLLAARGLTHRQLAERLQIGHASIARALALLGPARADPGGGGGRLDRPQHRLRAVQGRRPRRAGRPGPPGAEGRLRRDEIKGGPGRPGRRRAGGRARAARGCRRPGRSGSTAGSSSPSRTAGGSTPGPRPGRAPPGGGPGRGRDGRRPSRRLIAGRAMNRAWARGRPDAGSRWNRGSGAGGATRLAGSR